jgi:5'-3' exonuclease
MYAKSDADLQIVIAATECAKHNVTAVVGEDTDLLILLAHHTRTDSHDVFFYSDKQAKNMKLWSMKQLTTALGDLRHLLLFLHAFTGCDTTSRPFGVGKVVALKKLKNSPEFQVLAHIFLRDNSFETVESAGERALVLLYNGSPKESLDELRYRLFCSKVAVGTTCVQVHTLPPTSAAARIHSLRVYFQVQEWLGNKLTVQPTQCGWRHDHEFSPCDNRSSSSTSRPVKGDSMHVQE